MYCCIKYNCYDATNNVLTWTSHRSSVAVGRSSFAGRGWHEMSLIHSWTTRKATMLKQGVHSKQTRGISSIVFQRIKWWKSSLIRMGRVQCYVWSRDRRLDGRNRATLVETGRVNVRPVWWYVLIIQLRVSCHGSITDLKGVKWLAIVWRKPALSNEHICNKSFKSHLISVMKERRTLELQARYWLTLWTVAI